MSTVQDRQRLQWVTTGGHLRNTRHVLDLSSSSIVVRENDTSKRRIREAIEIHCQAPTLNRDVGELDMSSRRSTGTFRHMIFYQLNHVTKRPTPQDKDSKRESKACISR